MSMSFDSILKNKNIQIIKKNTKTKSQTFRRSEAITNYEECTMINFKKMNKH